ncbi:MAG: hypothetical protein ACI3X9_05880, partial [Bacteroidaceae bacterium]
KEDPRPPRLPLSRWSWNKKPSPLHGVAHLNFQTNKKSSTQGVLGLPISTSYRQVRIRNNSLDY